jgi:hypothetical protein
MKRCERAWSGFVLGVSAATGLRLRWASNMIWIPDTASTEKTTVAVNSEMIFPDCHIGRMACQRQEREFRGVGVIMRVAGDLRNEFREVKESLDMNIELMLPVSS